MHRMFYIVLYTLTVLHFTLYTDFAVNYTMTVKYFTLYTYCCTLIVLYCTLYTDRLTEHCTFDCEVNCRHSKSH